MKADILFLVHNRLDFLTASWSALLTNTDWSRVGSLFVMIDRGIGVPPEGHDTRRCEMWIMDRIFALDSDPLPCAVEQWIGCFGGPVDAMLKFFEPLIYPHSPVFCKIDSDVIVPPGWLQQGLQVMEGSPELSFLGIEPPESRTPAPWAPMRMGVTAFPECVPRALRYCTNSEGYAICDAIGGIGFMRRAAFSGRKPMVQHSTYGGFTDWQLAPAQRDLVKGWIVPSLKVFLLDRMPLAPWAELSKLYIAAGMQRPWTNYADTTENAERLWGWYLDSEL